MMNSHRFEILLLKYENKTDCKMDPAENQTIRRCVLLHVSDTV